MINKELYINDSIKKLRNDTHKPWEEIDQVSKENQFYDNIAKNWYYKQYENNSLICCSDTMNSTEFIEVNNKLITNEIDWNNRTNTIRNNSNLNNEINRIKINN